MNRTIAAAAVLMTVFEGTGFAQRASPEEVVGQFFKAEDEGRWLDAAHLLDLRRFESVRQTAVQSVRAVRDRRPTTPESIMQYQPDIPRAVAEYEAMRANKSMADYDLLGSQFARVSSADSLAALPIDVAAARWLEARDPRWQQQRATERALKEPRAECGPIDVGSGTLMAAARYKPPKAVILGTATAGDSAAYVVIGEASGLTPVRGFSASQVAGIGASPRVLEMSHVDDNWKVVPTMDIVGSSGSAGGVSVAIICESKKPASDATPKKKPN